MTFSSTILCRKVDETADVVTSPRELADLSAGGLPCPVCGAGCRPQIREFRTIGSTTDALGLVWSDGAWIQR